MMELICYDAAKAMKMKKMSPVVSDQPYEVLAVPLQNLSASAFLIATPS
jgi:hypothetical protein